MSYNLRLTLSNTRSVPVRTVIYGGTVFEVLDPFSGVQNLAAIDDTSITIAPGQTTVVDIDTWCINQSYRAPGNTPMRLTSLRLSSTYPDQHAVWRDFGERR